MFSSVSALIIARSVFSVAECVMGYGDYLLQNEWPLYILDALPMTPVMLMFCGGVPGELLQKDISSTKADAINTYDSLTFGIKRQARLSAASEIADIKISMSGKL